MKTDITDLKIKDIYTGLQVRVSTPAELGDWLQAKHRTHSDSLTRTIDSLCDALEAGEDYKWHAAANGLEITAKKTRGKSK